MKQAIELEVHFEGFNNNLYYCPSAHLTFGFGTLRSRYPNVSLPISRDDAEKILVNDTKAISDWLDLYVKYRLNPNQKGSLIDFCYNLGKAAFQRSTLRMKLNRGDINGAAREFSRWNKAKVKGVYKSLRGLTLRRECERKLFLTRYVNANEN